MGINPQRRFERCRRNDGLAQRDATIVGRNLGVQKHFEAILAQSLRGDRQQREVLKHTSTEAHFVHAADIPKLGTNRLNHNPNRIVKATGNGSG